MAQESAKPPLILIVDDDEGLLVLMQDALTEGHEVAVAKSGAEALRWLEKHEADLLLLDLKLKDVAGAALLNQIKQQCGSIPFIVITGQGDERVAVEMMKQGALDYVVKDTGMIDRLPAVVKRALEQLARDKELAATQTALRESEKQLLAISEREQRRFGAELHDGIGQQLTAIEFMCQSLKDDLNNSHRHLEKQVTKICEHLREAISQTRSLARGLSPVDLGAEGLSEALEELVRRTNELGKVKCAFYYPVPVRVEDSSVAGHLFRMAQEAVNNALKHSQATVIKLSLLQRGETVRLEIADNGKGLPRDKARAEGIGLHVMRHRAGMIGAELAVETAKGKGTKIICTVRRNKT